MSADGDSLRAPERAAKPPKRGLDTLLGARKISAAGAARHSRIVRVLRLVLPLVAVGIVGLLVSWPRVEERMLAPADTAAPAPQAVARNELINPRFESEDSDAQPYVVTAARAVQSTANPDIVMLEKPVGDLQLEKGGKVGAVAESGAYNQQAQTLTLEGHVKLTHDDGYEMTTEKLRVDMGARTVWSDTKVTGHGPAGTLEATGVKAAMADGQVIFTGPARLVLREAMKGL